MSTSMKSVAELVVDQLQAWGVQRVYGVVGDAILPLVSALANRDGIAFIPARHEEAAAIMAKTEAQTSGGIGVCTATSGPGAAHLVNGLADAKTDSAPVLAITGQVESYRVGTIHKQMIDQQSLLGAVTDFTFEIGHPHAVLEVMGEAIRIAFSRQTATHVSLPLDFWTATSPSSLIRPYAPYLNTPPRSGDEIIREAARRIGGASRPAILAGAGTRNAVGSVLQLAEHLRAPVIYTLAASGQFPGWHHLIVGGVGEGGADASSQLLMEADCILRLGATWWPDGYMPTDVDVIDINIRPDQIGIRVPDAYGVVARVEDALPYFFEVPSQPRPVWEERIWKLRTTWNDHLAREAALTSGPTGRNVYPAYIVHALKETLPEDAIITLDVGEHVLWFGRHFRGNGRQDVLVSGYWRTMGFALPAAIGARLTNPNRPVVAFVGDGGFSMSMAELLTAVRLHVPVVVVVLNNASLGMEENEMKRLGLTVDGVSLNNPDFAGYARLCGAQGFRVDKAEELIPTLRQAFQEQKVTVVDVHTAGSPLPLPKKVTAESQPVRMEVTM